mmetsp:Transcript_119334/g.371730  ORF Transcript_119334/g.371730 Transcript_119334/m.371730 type:complete len:313 (-) Transcript_119334:315-1253(-)
MGSQSSFTLAVGLDSWSSRKSLSSTVSCASLMSPAVSGTETSRLKQLCLVSLTRSRDSKVTPSTSSSFTSQSRCRSPSSRNLHSQKPERLSMSSAVVSQRTSPSTVSVSTLLVLYLFSSSMVCSAKGPICSTQAFFHLELCSLTDLTAFQEAWSSASPIRKCARVSRLTSEVTRSLSFETFNNILGFSLHAPSLASLDGGGVGLAKQCVSRSSPSRDSTQCMGSCMGTCRVRLRRCMDRGFFMPPASRMFSGFTAGKKMVCTSSFFFPAGMSLSIADPLMPLSERLGIRTMAEKRPSCFCSCRVAGNQDSAS